ncbi:MAG: hypothetical protein QNI84_06580 [Henriciella sp.]|nr:hypothetical protein [Henriciella sp.]
MSVEADKLDYGWIKLGPKWKSRLERASTVLTVIGLASFMEDLQTWRNLFIWIFHQLENWVTPFRQIAYLLSNGLDNLIHLYRMIVYPIIQWIGNIVSLEIPEFLYDPIFIASITLSAWARVFLSLMPKVISERSNIPKRPKAPKKPYNHLLGIFHKGFDYVVLNDTYHRRKAQFEREVQEYKRAVSRFYENFGKYAKAAGHQWLVSLISGAISFSFVFSIWLIDWAFMNYFDA